MSDFGLEAKPQELLALGKYRSTATSAIGMIPVPGERSLLHRQRWVYN
jgi:hypothetical protein